MLRRRTRKNLSSGDSSRHETQTRRHHLSNGPKRITKLHHRSLSTTLSRRVHCLAGLSLSSSAAAFPYVSNSHVANPRLVDHTSSRLFASSSHPHPITQQHSDGPYPLHPEYLDRVKASHMRSISDPSGYWLEQASHLDWFRRPNIGHQVNPDGSSVWFPDGLLNLSHLTIDANIAAGRGKQDAYIVDNAYRGTAKHITYNMLLKETTKAANMLKSLGLEKGDHVMLYMPMIEEATYIMQACHRLGIVYTVTFGGFASHELGKRLTAFKPKVLFAASCGLEPHNKIVDYHALIHGALSQSGYAGLKKIIYVDREEHPLDRTAMDPQRDVFYNDIVHNSTTPVDPIPLPSSDTSYLIYTSGTTAAAKGIVRETGGYATALLHAMKHVYGMKPGQTWFAASDFAWVVGLSFVLLGPLLNGNTSIVFEGKPIQTPDSSTYWRIAADYNVSGMFTAPTAIRALKQTDPTLSQASKYINIIQHNKLKIHLAGERSDPDSLLWLSDTLHVPVVDHYWFTEAGTPTTHLPRSIDWPDTTIQNIEGWAPNPRHMVPGSAGHSLPGYNYSILDDNGQPIITPNTPGNLALRLPLPPGFMTTVHQSPERYKAYFTRFDGYFDTSDMASMDHRGLIQVLGRSDDVFNVAGHRLSSGPIEECISSIDAIAESCVVPTPDNIKGALPVVFAVLKSTHLYQGDDRDAAKTTQYYNNIRKQIRDKIRQDVGPIASPKTTIFVRKLPKTRSGKVLRKTLREMIHYLIYMEQMKHGSTNDANTTSSPSSSQPQQQQHDSNTIYDWENDTNRAIYNKIVPFPATIEDPDILDSLVKSIAESNIIKDGLETQINVKL